MEITHATRVVSTALVGAALILTSASAISAPVLGAPIIVQRDGPVIATFIGQDAAFVDELFLDSPTGAFSGVIFNNHTSPVGSTVNLGNFTAGTELIFRLHVTDTGLDFFTGGASRNPDGEAHAQIDAAFGGPDTTLVSFEDLHASVSDHDFNDLIYSFTNTGIVPSVPEPSTYMLLIAGLGLTAASRRFLNAKRGAPRQK